MHSLFGIQYHFQIFVDTRNNIVHNEYQHNFSKRIVVDIRDIGKIHHILYVYDILIAEVLSWYAHNLDICNHKGFGNILRLHFF